MVELSLLFEVACLLGASAHHFALSRFAVVHVSSPVMMWFWFWVSGAGDRAVGQRGGDPITR
jgi:hypothetical protein